MTTNVIPFPTKLREPVVQPSAEVEWARLRVMGKWHKVIRAERHLDGVHIYTACSRSGRMVPGEPGQGSIYCQACRRFGWEPPRFHPDDLLTAS
jgi:hypothetical protein